MTLDTRKVHAPRFNLDIQKYQIPVSYPSISEHQGNYIGDEEGEAEKFYTAKPQPGTTITETGHYRELSPDYILIRLDMILRQVFYLSNLSCPVCGGVTLRLVWNLGIIRYEFCLLYNCIFLSERRHYVTFHPLGIFRYHWSLIFTFLFYCFVSLENGGRFKLKFGLCAFIFKNLS